MHWYNLAPWGFPWVSRRLPVCLRPVSASSASSGRCRAGSSCDLGRNTRARLSGIGTHPGVCGRSARNSAAWRPTTCIGIARSPLSRPAHAIRRSSHVPHPRPRPTAVASAHPGRLTLRAAPPGHAPLGSIPRRAEVASRGFPRGGGAATFSRLADGARSMVTPWSRAFHSAPTLG
jgi:hypothetical protein